jgi:hypothetical protein
MLEHQRPHLELVPPPPAHHASDPIELLPSAHTPRARPTLTMSGVTSSLQLLLAARRAARFSTGWQ